jgi:type II secretory pathway component PulM
MLKRIWRQLTARLGGLAATYASRARSAAAPYVARARARLEPLYAQARARYERLEPRERLLVNAAGALLAVFVVFNYILVPISNVPEAIATRAAERRRDLQQVRRLAAIHEQLKSDLAAAQTRTVPRSRDFSLFGVVESALRNNLERDRIASIAPGPERKLGDGLRQLSVELKLSDVDLKQLVDVLFAIRTLPTPVAVSKVHIARRGQNTHSYDVDLTCIALARDG